MDSENLSIGLLLETAQAQQAAIDQLLRETEARQGQADSSVSAVLEDALARCVAGLNSTSVAAAERLAIAVRTAAQKTAAWCVAASAISVAVVTVPVLALLPSRHDIERLRVEHRRWSESIALQRAEAGGLELRACGRERRPCVRIDRSAPAYGEGADFRLVAEP